MKPRLVSVILSLFVLTDLDWPFGRRSEGRRVLAEAAAGVAAEEQVNESEDRDFYCQDGYGGGDKDHAAMKDWQPSSSSSSNGSTTCSSSSSRSRPTRSSRYYSQELKTWLVDSMGGYWNDKVDIQQVGNPPSFGMFAIQDLEEGELVFHFPRRSYFQLDREEVIAPELYDESEAEEEEEEEEMEWEDVLSESLPHGQNTCRLAKRLLNEIQQYRRHEESSSSSSSSSQHAPYIQYLEETQRRGQLPATYSPAGKQLLRTIQGIRDDDDEDGGRFLSPAYGKSPLPPAGLVDWIDTDVLSQQGCGGEDRQEEAQQDTEELYHAIALTVQRGFDLELIPIWDMVNHDLEHRWNVNTSSLRSDDGLKVWTTRPISAGEEILYTYNYCKGCWDHGDYFGTPGIYREFGFLESYPQEWPFLDHDVYAAIRRRSNGTANSTATARNTTALLCHQNSSSYYATFYSDDEKMYAPDASAIAFFQEQLQRLKALDISAKLQALSSSYEKSMIQTFYDSLVIALDSIISAGLEHLQQQQQQQEERE